MSIVEKSDPRALTWSARPADVVPFVAPARGFAGVGLFQPKDPVNVGGALRAAFNYDADFIAVHGRRFKRAPTDTMKAYRHLPVFDAVDDLFDVIPYGCVPVAVEMSIGAEPLPTYRHPERAFYIFGPEDGFVAGHVLARCRDVVYVPTRGPMNLAGCVNVVLYDRAAKRERSAS